MDQIYELFLQYPLISTDTRNIKPNSIFFCLKGEHFDGNSFVLQALEKGAKYVVTDDPVWHEIENCMVVENALETLQQLALYHRKKMNIPVIGITGTNGKTTTKELLHRVLSKKYKTACTKGNLNNHIGVPLTLLDIKPEDEIAIVEMGANHPGEIADLCELSLPNYGIITNVGNAHLEGFGSFENVVKAKTALYDAVIRAEGTLFVNADDEILRQYVSSYPHKVCYSGKEKSEINGKVMAMNPFLTIELFCEELETMMTGYYNLYNILCAAAVGLFFDVEKNDIREAIVSYSPDNQRSQLIYCGTTTIIADYYNANPDSMQAALINLSRIEHPAKMAILGDMFELGNVSRFEHQKIVELTKQLNIESYFVGKAFCEVFPEKEVSFPDTDALNHFLMNKNLDNKLILLKGSRGMHFERLKLFEECDL